MEEKPKKSIASLGSVAGSIRKESSPQKESAAPDRVIEIRRPYFPPPPPSPVSIKLDNLRALDDDTLMKLLTSEIGSGERPLSDGTKMAITAELMRRQAWDARKPHVPSFALLVTGVVISVLALGYTIYSDQKKSTQPGAAQHPTPLPAGSAQAPAPTLPATTGALKPSR